MEPLSIIGAILKVAQEIAKAATTAGRNRSRCLELAERVRNVGALLRDSKAAKDTATRRRVLGRLSEALGDALKLVQSCRRGGLIFRLLAAGRDAGRFDDVERKINNCLMDLGIANDARLERRVNQLAARGNHPGTNAKAGSQKINHNAKSSTAAAGERTNKGRYAGRKGKQMKEKAAPAGPLPCGDELSIEPGRAGTARARRASGRVVPARPGHPAVPRRPTSSPVRPRHGPNPGRSAATGAPVFPITRSTLFSPLRTPISAP